ncbi:MAG: NADH-quinone oxidoreductase subunit NuoK [Acidobacteria bacterium]|nr:MAG: NADH-quinone oxidoreductase subunit NuoK [Acidobacteriota bacterium]
MLCRSKSLPCCSWRQLSAPSFSPRGEQHDRLSRSILFAIGTFGFLARRNIILMLISVEVMLNAVNLSLAGFSRHLGDLRGQVLALFVIAVAAAEVGVGLGLVIALNRNKPGAAVADLTKLKW